MFSSWFSHGFFTKKTGKNQNIQKRIGSLFSSTTQEEKDASPTLKELQRQRNKVKRMSSVYEENIAAYNEKNNSTIIPRSPGRFQLDRKPLTAKIDDVVNHFMVSFQRSLKYLIKIETQYIYSMEQLIEKYVKAFDDIPALRLKDEATITSRQKEELFGPIEQVYTIHKFGFFPILAACSGDVLFFAKQISNFAQSGILNAYLIYAMDEKAYEHRRKVYYKFFLDEIMDKCGFAYEIDHIEQLSRYHQVIIDMLKELKDLNAPEDTIEALAQTEDDWKCMLDQIYEMREASRSSLM